MITLLVASLIVLPKGDQMPFQIIPRSQFGFGMREMIKESSAGEPTGMFVVNDEYTSNELLETISKKEMRSTLVELFRKTAEGKFEFWGADGKKISESPVTFDEEDAKTFKVGEIAAIIDNVYAFEDLSSPKDRPRQNLNLTVSRMNSMANGKPGHMVVIHRLGVPKSKYANIRFGINVETYAGSFGIEPGSTATFEGIEFKVIGPIENKSDQSEHIEIAQSRLLRRGGYSLFASFDWKAYEKSVGHAVDHDQVSSNRMIKKLVPTLEDIRFDFAINKPMKFVKCVNVVRISNIDGYFGHIATEPIETSVPAQEASAQK